MICRKQILTTAFPVDSGVVTFAEHHIQQLLFAFKERAVDKVPFRVSSADGLTDAGEVTLLRWVAEEQALYALIDTSLNESELQALDTVPQIATDYPANGRVYQAVVIYVLGTTGTVIPGLSGWQRIAE